jgi:hypothetical protein
MIQTMMMEAPAMTTRPPITPPTIAAIGRSGPVADEAPFGALLLVSLLLVVPVEEVVVLMGILKVIRGGREPLPMSLPE